MCLHQSIRAGWPQGGWLWSACADSRWMKNRGCYSPSSSSSPPLLCCARLFTSPLLLHGPTVAMNDSVVVHLLEQKVKHWRLTELLETKFCSRILNIKVSNLESCMNSSPRLVELALLQIYWPCYFIIALLLIVMVHCKICSRSWHISQQNDTSISLHSVAVYSCIW